MRRLALFGSLALLLVACTSVEEAKQKHRTEQAADGDVEPGDGGDDARVPPPPPTPMARASISSVQMIEDCPDQPVTNRLPPPAGAAPAAPAPGVAMPSSKMRRAPGALGPGGDSTGFRQPCTQSTMQLAFTGQGPSEARVVIEQVRLVDPSSGKTVGRAEARKPAAWIDSSYHAWDEMIPEGKDIKSSYELSDPDWSAVEAAIGGSSSYDHMFVLEVVVKVGDEQQTVHSAPFPRERPHVIVT